MLPYTRQERLRIALADIESARKKLEILQTTIPIQAAEGGLHDVMGDLSRALGLLGGIEEEEVPEVVEEELYCEQCGSQLIYKVDTLPQSRFMASSDYVGGRICLPCLAEHCAQTNCLQCDLGNWPKCKYEWIKKLH